jgi:GTPase SAR1 family protein
MSVVVIGERGVGKTSMVVALANKSGRNLSVEDAEAVAARRSNIDTGEIAGTAKMTVENLQINIELPTGLKQINVLWIDTPGEAFSNSDWKQQFPTAWQEIEQQIKESRGIILLMPPHSDLVHPNRIDSRTTVYELPSSKAWRNSLHSWLNFFKKNCAQVDHIAICLHRADTFCDIQNEGKKWRYDSSTNGFWFRYDNHIRKNYFATVEDLIREYNSRTRVTPRLFITTIDEPSLLELPWIYLGTFIANS